ncbi:hypothetical protein HOG21_00805 [bacterium]|nr:hypothetical protein [bacterium]
MNSLISHGQARKKSLLPALTQKAKFVNFCYEIEIIKQELLMLFHDEQNNEIDHSNTDDKIEKIIREIVNTFLKKSTIYTKSRYSNNVNFI